MRMSSLQFCQCIVTYWRICFFSNNIWNQSVVNIMNKSVWLCYNDLCCHFTYYTTKTVNRCKYCLLINLLCLPNFLILSKRPGANLVEFNLPITTSILLRGKPRASCNIAASTNYHGNKHWETENMSVHLHRSAIRNLSIALQHPTNKHLPSTFHF